MAAISAFRQRPSAVLLRLAVQYRPIVQAGMDAAAWAVALLFATVVRYDFDLDEVDLRGWVVIGVLAAITQTLAGLGCGLYTGRFRFGSFEEVAGLIVATTLATTVLFGLNLVAPGGQAVPKSAVVAGGVTATVLMGGVRYTWRLLWERRRRPTGDDCERILVFGAGDGGAQVISAMMADPQSPYLPVALLDDNPAKRNLRIKGVRVVGTRDRIGEAAFSHRAQSLLIAIPTASAELVSELTDRALGADLTVKVLPPVRELFGGDVGVADIREVTEADLLGRHEIAIDLASIANYLTGRRVMVTGAGGSIGSELCRQVHRLGPSELIMVDRDESALHAVQLSIEGRALLDSPDLVLLDIRDRPRLNQVFAERRPEVVFHAAALKHQPLLEQYPGEAVKSNVWGTLAVLEAAAAAGVTRFVNISTDKAADPCSVLGYSKRIAERLTAYVASQTEGTYLSVRFGNVLGSRGSMLGTFHAQIDAGGPITVTHPEVSRYFMTIEEAVQLVIQAGAFGRDGEALVLDMGQPVMIADVARRLAELAERPVDIVYTGLRPGEKLHEVLLGEGEPDDRPVHPLVSHVRVPPLYPEDAYRLEPSEPAAVVIEQLRQLCTATVVTGLPPR
ncbi:MAG: polysaccharide biosynthesis protein [Actinomycetota bacterium]|nr:polysaccharide biosynthesis protein [Actinomycetota bacterium]